MATKKGKGSGWYGEKRRHELAGMGYKTVLPDGRRMDVSKFVAAGRIEVDMTKGHLTESEVGLLKRRLNAGEEIDLSMLYDGDGMLLTPGQNQKGYDWLMDKWKTPAGRERKNNPFGHREEAALEDFSHFTLTGFYNTSPYGQHYMPVYTLWTKDGYGFEYYGFGDEIRIVG